MTWPARTGNNQYALRPAVDLVGRRHLGTAGSGRIPDMSSENNIRQLKQGLWHNIRAKRERGEKPARPGDKDYPDSKQWKKLSGK